MIYDATFSYEKAFSGVNLGCKLFFNSRVLIVFRTLRRGIYSEDINLRHEIKEKVGGDQIIDKIPKTNAGFLLPFESAWCVCRENLQTTRKSFITIFFSIGTILIQLSILI